MKASILKPVLWNSRNYMGPSGDGAASGYPAEHGFGHEEWNNHPGWIWSGDRVFHTESTKRLREYSENGELGMLMIASHNGGQYAVGVAAGVFHNIEEEMRLIAADLHLYENWRELWALDIVRRKHHNDQRAFCAFWRTQCQWVQWKVDPQMYHWFKEPIPLDPMQLVGKERLTVMFGKWQRIRPECIVSVIRAHVPRNKRALVAWFEDGGFDERFLQGKKPRSPGPHGNGCGGGSAPSRAFRYWVHGEREAEPLHYVLQRAYISYLKARGLNPVPDEDYVDVRYEENGKTVFVEVKPTEKVPPRYAIRAAIGQLFEYRHQRNPRAEVEIVISTKPEPERENEQVVDLLKTLGIRLWHRKRDKFARLA